MSLVTTATSSSGASLRQSAATSAVFPLPTGPPTPMRSARSDPADSLAGCGSGGKQTHLHPEMALGGDVEHGGRRAGQVFEGAERGSPSLDGDGLDGGSQA